MTDDAIKRDTRQRRRRGQQAEGFTLDRHSFPALTEFLRGYLHEDFAHEYGSAIGAAAAFRSDASVTARQEVVRELHALLESARGWPARDFSRFLTRDLGSRWQPQSVADAAALLAVLQADQLPPGLEN